jgi:hypothetical protein
MWLNNVLFMNANSPENEMVEDVSQDKEIEEELKEVAEEAKETEDMAEKTVEVVEEEKADEIEEEMADEIEEEMADEIEEEMADEIEEEMADEIEEEMADEIEEEMAALADRMFHPEDKHPYYLNDRALGNLRDLVDSLNDFTGNEGLWVASWLEYLGDEGVAALIRNWPEDFKQIVIAHYNKLKDCHCCTICEQSG